jgi:hypothetical protein
MSRRQGLAFPKPKPAALVKDERDAAWRARDERESAKVRRRSKGICEVTIGGVRCTLRGREVHHHIGGWKLRGRGESALAKNKTHCCIKHHTMIERNVLEHVAGNRYKEWGT